MKWETYLSKTKKAHSAFAFPANRDIVIPRPNAGNHAQGTAQGTAVPHTRHKYVQENPPSSR